MQNNLTCAKHVYEIDPLCWMKRVVDLFVQQYEILSVQQKTKDQLLEVKTKSIFKCQVEKKSNLLSY